MSREKRHQSLQVIMRATLLYHKWLAVKGENFKSNILILNVLKSALV